MGKYDDCDFCGWVTVNNVLCKDGRRIMRDAFAHQDGMKVPLVWGHQHDSPEAVLGHIFLENRPEGVRGYGYLNDSPMGQYSRIAIEHGDVDSLSIWANELKQNGGDVLHGSIKEVSLVLAGANEEAHIDYPYVAHGDAIEENMTEAEICYGEHCQLEHSAMKDENEKQPEEKASDGEATVKEAEPTEEKETKMAEEKKEKETEEESTVGEVLDTLNEDQKKAVSVLIAAAMAKNRKPEDDSKEEEKEEPEEVKHSDDMEDTTMQYNAFNAPADENGSYVLSHSDELDIINSAKKMGKFREALNAFADEKSLAHDGLAPVSGFTSYPSGSTPAGVDALFPEWHDVRPGAPEVITNDREWVSAVLNKVHKTPFSRIRTSQVDIRTIEGIRAKGYAKGTAKVLAENYTVAKRTTSPTTVYAKSALNRDDVVDITDFSYVDYQYKIDRGQLEFELAQAMLIGDGRDAAANDKIDPECIRPIYTDNSIFAIRKVVDATAANNDPGFGANYLLASAVEEAILDAKIDYRGSGAMDMFCEQSFFNKLQLAKDLNGRRLYSNKGELMTTLGVNNVYAVPEFQGKTRTVGTGSSARTYKLLAILGNLADYSMGATKGGEITHFTDFDIDFNQLKSLIETRCSGAVTRIGSFIILEEEVV